MRSILLIPLFLSVPTLLFAHPHQLAFYADRNATSCALAAGTSGFLEVHVMLEGSGNIIGIAFRALKPSCMNNAVFISDAWDWDGGIVRGGPGNTQHSTGVIVATHCHAAPIYIGRIMYVLNGPVDPCCRYGPTPYLDGPSPVIAVDQVVSCTEIPARFIFESATAKGVVINPDPTCSCDFPLAIEHSTWGSVKALYR